MREIHAHLTLTPEQELTEEEQAMILGSTPFAAIEYPNGSKEIFGQALAPGEEVDTTAAQQAIEAGTIQGFGFGQNID